MNYSNYRFTLDIQSNLSQVSLPVKLNDTGRCLLIGLTDGGNPYTISDGSMAKFTYKKAEPNSEGVYEAGIYDCILEDNYSTIRFDLTSAVTNVAGVVDCEIRLYGPNGRLLTSPRFIMVVDDRVIYDDDIPLSEDQASTIDAIILTEAARVEAETNRADAETARREAEAERESACEDAVTKADNAATNAQNIADTLSQKLESGDYRGEDGVDGKDGADGVSATHSWNGTVLTVTSASGSSSADLKGDKGDQGIQGEKGATGATGATGAKGDDGYTPQKGVDYWTSADKAEMLNALYPIGAIYISTNYLSPASYIGGEWERIKECFLWAAGGGDGTISEFDIYAGETGGSADAVVVEHRHQGLYWGDITPNSYITLNTQGGVAYGLSYGSSDNSNTIFTGREGVDGTGKNMPPYLGVYMWQRVA